MFPSNQYKDTVTIYTPRVESGGMRYYRRVLRRCFWNADSVTVNRSGGTAAPSQVTLNIPLPHNAGYIDRDAWVSAQDLGRRWTIRTGGEQERSIILRGDVSYPELEIMQGRESLERTLSGLRRTWGTAEHNPGNVEEILYGPASMHRVVCVC